MLLSSYFTGQMGLLLDPELNNFDIPGLNVTMYLKSFRLNFSTR